MEKTEFNYLLKKSAVNVNAFERLYGFYYKRIIFHFSGIYGKTLAEDVAQDFFIHLGSVASDQEDVEFPTAWIYKCCDNIAKRKITEESRYKLIGENAAAEPDIDFRSAYGDLYDAITQLDEKSQKIIFLHHWEGYSLKEIAPMTGLTYDNVKQKHKRALQKIKQNLEELSLSGEKNVSIEKKRRDTYE